MSYYCDIAPGHPFHGPYHENEYGFPAREDAILFERLALEINQARLSWLFPGDAVRFCGALGTLEDGPVGIAVAELLGGPSPTPLTAVTT